MAKEDISELQLAAQASPPPLNPKSSTPNPKPETRNHKPWTLTPDP
jgi:hypothetical protein